MQQKGLHTAGQHSAGYLASREVLEKGQASDI